MDWTNIDDQAVILITDVFICQDTQFLSDTELNYEWHHINQDLIMEYVGVTDMNVTSGNESVASSSYDYVFPEKPSKSVENLVDTLFVAGNVLGISSVILNIAFLFAVRLIKDRRTTYFRLIQNLAVADDLAALTFLITQNWPHGPFAYIDPQAHFVLANGLSYVFRGLPWMFFTAYLLTLSSLTLNQYIAICMPMRYNEITERKVTVVILIIWCLSSLQLFIPLIIVVFLHAHFNPRDAMDALFAVSKIELHIWMAFFVVTIFFNTALDLVAYMKIQELKLKSQNSLRGSTCPVNIQQKQQAFITLTLLLVASIFCRLPFPVVGIVGLNMDYSMGATAVELTQAVVVFLLYVNFLADPVICLVRTHEVRRTYRSLYALCVTNYCCCDRRSSNGGTYHLGMTRFDKKILKITSQRSASRSHKTSKTSSMDNTKHTQSPEDFITVDNINITNV